MQYYSRSPEQTEEIGARYAGELRPGDVVALEGDLGAGKTAFVRGGTARAGLRGAGDEPDLCSRE